MINSVLKKEFNLKEEHLNNVISLIDEGKTIPFIARYRKEQTGEMSDEALRVFSDRLKYLRNLEDRKNSIIKSIEEQGKLTDEIAISLSNAMTLVEIEDIYEPFKKKKKTRASVAIEKGLEPLANIILLGQDYESSAVKFIDEEKGVNNEKDAISGASDIIAQMIAEDFELKKQLRKVFFDESVIETSLKKDGEEKENYQTYKMYFEFSELTNKIVPHRILAIDRGENEDILKVKINYPEEKFKSIVWEKYKFAEKNIEIMNNIIDDSLKRLLVPSLERELRSELSEKAQERAITVFGQNLSKLLLQSPIQNKVILGWDPAYRTGCKIAVVDDTGKLLDTTTVYPTQPQNKIDETKKIILSLIKKHNVNLIAIGNGTASRESEQIVSEIIKDTDVKYLIVSEAGASVYSASELGTKEFPDLNVSLRGAVSIARRVIDPLAELVKISPEHIGVGQYQHDVNQTKLKDTLGGVVEASVNMVGVDVNTASTSLLSYVSGISPSIAKNIVEFREENGKFTNRKELLKVKRLGESTFEQCAGFLRIKDSQEILDNTSVHPESYTKAKLLLNELEIDSNDLLNQNKSSIDKLNNINIKEISTKLDIGIPTLKDIITELKKPGRDIRDEAPSVILKSDILDIDDLKIGSKLKGTIRNVVDFGAFVDIGIKNDGLVHISQLSEKYVKNPLDVVSVGDIVDVTVIGIDKERGKVQLSMKKDA